MGYFSFTFTQGTAFPVPINDIFELVSRNILDKWNQKSPTLAPPECKNGFRV